MLPGVGVFGTSLTARVIIPLLKDEGFAVKALWGRTQEEAEELAKEMSVPFYTSRIDEVLLHQDVDLVCINLPPPLTRQIAVKTLAYWGRWGFRLNFLLSPPPPPRPSLHPRGKVEGILMHEASTNSPVRMILPGALVTSRCQGSRWDHIGYVL
uniref:Glucose-fructose oxidoreductase domain containing 1 n=1 Tax=Ursus maritimus TaxID=29073 RepID=A0A384C885_URSMA